MRQTNHRLASGRKLRQYAPRGPSLTLGDFKRNLAASVQAGVHRRGGEWRIMKALLAACPRLRSSMFISAAPHVSTVHGGTTHVTLGGLRLRNVAQLHVYLKKVGCKRRRRGRGRDGQWRVACITAARRGRPTGKSPRLVSPAELYCCVRSDAWPVATTVVCVCDRLQTRGSRTHHGRAFVMVTVGSPLRSTPTSQWVPAPDQASHCYRVMQTQNPTASLQRPKRKNA